MPLVIVPSSWFRSLSTRWRNGEEHRYFFVSIECAPISLYEISKTFNDLRDLRGSKAETLPSLLFFRHKQERSCIASNPVIWPMVRYNSLAQQENEKDKFHEIDNLRCSLPSIYLTSLWLRSSIWTHNKFSINPIRDMDKLFSHRQAGLPIFNEVKSL